MYTFDQALIVFRSVALLYENSVIAGLILHASLLYIQEAN